MGTMWTRGLNEFSGDVEVQGKMMKRFERVSG